MSQNNKQEIKHPDRPDTTNAPYSSAVLCDGWLYVSGQGPLDLKTMTIVGNGIEEQTRVTLENIRQLLEAGGASFADVVKYAENHKVHNRTAAYMVALDRVAFAIKLRGIYA